MLCSHYRLSYGGLYNDQEVRLASNLRRHVGAYLFSRAVASQVSSARQSLTSVFGMGTGGPSALITPTLIDVLSPIFLTPSEECSLKTKQENAHNNYDQSIVSRTICSSSPRSISIGQLNALLHLHLRPIKQVVYL